MFSNVRPAKSYLLMKWTCGMTVIIWGPADIQSPRPRLSWCPRGHLSAAFSPILRTSFLSSSCSSFLWFWGDFNVFKSPTLVLKCWLCDDSYGYEVSFVQTWIICHWLWVQLSWIKNREKWVVFKQTHIKPSCDQGLMGTSSYISPRSNGRVFTILHLRWFYRT